MSAAASHRSHDHDEQRPAEHRLAATDDEVTIATKRSPDGSLDSVVDPIVTSNGGPSRWLASRGEDRLPGGWRRSERAARSVHKSWLRD